MVAQGKVLSFPLMDQDTPPLPYVQRVRLQGALALATIATTHNLHLEVNGIPVAESLFALLSGMVLVSGATDAVERMTASQIPTFSPNSQRFDANTFGGRFCQMLLACDPRLLLYSRDEVEQCRDRVLSFDSDNHDRDPSTDRSLWEAKRIADSALQPETDQWIPRPFRMSGYLPANGPICVAMLAAPSAFYLLLGSWLNQSQNAMINYFNRNPSSEMSLETLWNSYIVAVATALGVAFGLASSVSAHYPAEEAQQLLQFISFPSAVVASSLNCWIVRSPEIEPGVPLLVENQDDGTLEPVLPGETSRAAAQRGVVATTASRAVLQMPTYMIPPLLLETVLKPCLVDHPSMTVPMTTFVLLISFGIGLPCAIGIFPQMSTIEEHAAEEKYRGLGYEKFYYNKGL